MRNCVRFPGWLSPESTVGGSPGMLRVGHYLFKRAESKQEFEQVHRLNHRTFVDEIPQHKATGTGVLVDKFHHKSVYLSCCVTNAWWGWSALMTSRLFPW